MLEVYEATPVFIPIDITEDVVESVARKLSGSAVASGMDIEALQGWLVKLGDHSRKLCANVKSFVDSLSKKSHHGLPVRYLCTVA